MCIFMSANQVLLLPDAKPDIPIKVFPCSKTILAARASAFWRIWFCNLGGYEPNEETRQTGGNRLDGETLAGQDALSAPSPVGLGSSIDSLLKLGGGGLGDASEQRLCRLEQRNRFVEEMRGGRRRTGSTTSCHTVALLSTN